MIDFPNSRDLEVRGCLVCSRLEQHMMEYFAEQQGRLSRSEEAQFEYADKGGFCPLHTWQLATFSSPWGISKGHSAIILQMAGSLEQLADAHDEGVANVFPAIAPKDCVVCRFLAESEERCVTGLSIFLEKDEHLECYMRSHGICLRHLQLVLSQLKNVSRKVCLIRLAVNRLREIGESMVEYNLKHKNLKRDTLTKDEKDAYRRCLVMIAGERAVYSPFLKKM